MQELHWFNHSINGNNSLSIYKGDQGLEIRKT